MSRTKYVEQLQRYVEASHRVIDDLTQENYYLKALLQEQRHETRTSSQTHRQDREARAAS